VIVAVGQLHVGEGDVDINARGCRRALEDAAVQGAELLVLPECALTGYLFADRDAAEVAAIRACDPRIRELGDLAVQAGMTVVVGFLERAGDTLANSAAVLGSDGGVTLVRKTHLPVRAVENGSSSRSPTARGVRRTRRSWVPAAWSRPTARS